MPTYEDALSPQAQALLQAQYGSGGKRYGAVASWRTIAKGVVYDLRGFSLAETFFRSDHPAQLHYGFWSETTADFDEAIRRASDSALKQIFPTLPERASLIHLGSGFGGVDVQLCLAHPSLETLGVSIDPFQVEVARELARLRGVDARARFAEQNFLALQVDRRLGGGLAIESLCHVPGPQLPLLWRNVRAALLPRARFVVHDWYRRPGGLAQDEQDLEVFLRGWDMADCVEAAEMIEAAVGEGFTLVSDEDVTELILPSARRIYLRARLFKPLHLLVKGREVPWLKSLGLTDPQTSDFLETCLIQRSLFERRVISYRQLVFQAPDRQPAIVRR